MLESLRISNFAIIDEADVPFGPGLNILSGETGAGKSIVIEAISLVLGGRASADVVRAAADEATIEGLFDLASLPWMVERLDKAGIRTEGRQLLIKRVISRNGRGRVYLNGELATVSLLHSLCDGLVDLCGQHEHQLLTRAGYQLDLLDRYGGHTAVHAAYAQAHQHARALEREEQMLVSLEGERVRRMEYLRFQLAELSAARPEPGEEERLATEKQMLQSTEARALQIQAILGLLGSGEGEAHESGHGYAGSRRAHAPTIEAALQSAVGRLQALVELDERLAPELERARMLADEVQELELALTRYGDRIETSPERLEAVTERLSQVAELKRKFGTDVAGLIATERDLASELASLENHESRLAEIRIERERAQAQLLKCGRELTRVRRKTAELFGSSVTGELKDLKMAGAVLKVELRPIEDVLNWGPQGAETIEFVAQTNPGEPLASLGKVASGGELSRLMLAIRRVISDQGGIGVYLFDEIDAGIGGQTAFEVGKKLKSVAAHNQVICITHLPQVASFAAHHLHVSKSTRGERTTTRIESLAIDRRREEIARMLGGPKLTPKSLASAAELIGLAR